MILISKRVRVQLAFQQVTMFMIARQFTKVDGGK